MTYEIRLHGIGGQGVAAAAELMALAAIVEGKWSQAFPFFGTEIRGGSVKAFTRVSLQPIRTRSFIYKPDLIVVFSSYLLSPEVVDGARSKTTVLVNSRQKEMAVPGFPSIKIDTIDAEGIKESTPGCRMSNAVLMGAMLHFTNIQLESLEEAFYRKYSKDIAKSNILGARAGFQYLT